MNDLRIGLLMVALALALALLLLGPATALEHVLPLLAKRVRDLSGGEAFSLLLVVGLLTKD